MKKERQTLRYTNGYINGWVNEWMDAGMDRQMEDRQIDAVIPATDKAAVDSPIIRSKFDYLQRKAKLADLLV